MDAVYVIRQVTPLLISHKWRFYGTAHAIALENFEGPKRAGGFAFRQLTVQIFDDIKTAASKIRKQSPQAYLLVMGRMARIVNDNLYTGFGCGGNPPKILPVPLIALYDGAITNF